MPLGHFKNKYGEDIGAVMLEEINKRIAASQVCDGLRVPSILQLLQQVQACGMSL